MDMVAEQVSFFDAALPLRREFSEYLPKVLP